MGVLRARRSVRRVPAATTGFHPRDGRRMAATSDVRRRHWRADPASAGFSSAARSCPPNGHLPSSGLPSLDHAGVAVGVDAVADVGRAPATGVLFMVWLMLLLPPVPRGATARRATSAARVVARAGAGETSLST